MATGTTAVQTIDVVTPAAGESVTEGTILEWHVKVGDPIKLDDTIVEISTDKVDVELPSPGSGIVSEILVDEGETVTVGQVIARISVNGSVPPAAPGPAEPELDESPEQPLAPEAQASSEPEATAPAAPSDTPATNGSAANTVDVLTPAAGEAHHPCHKRVCANTGGLPPPRRGRVGGGGDDPGMACAGRRPDQG